MKSLLILLAIISICRCADPIREAICETYRGWGEGFAGTECGVSTNTSCTAVLDVLPELVTFFITLDFTKIGALVQDIYRAVVETGKQFSVCKFFQYFIGFFPHVYRFFRDILTNWMKIQGDVLCVFQNWAIHDYYHSGLCLGNIWKIILAE